METKNLTMKEFKSLDCIYGSVERLFDVLGYNVRFLMRDVRGDSCDDGGFILAISNKDNLFHLHAIEVNYNYTIDYCISKMFGKSTASFKSSDDLISYLKDLYLFINKHIDLAEDNIRLEDVQDDPEGYYDEYPEAIGGLNERGEIFMNQFFTILWPYSEYIEENNEAINKMFWYEPDYSYDGAKKFIIGDVQ